MQNYQAYTEKLNVQGKEIAVLFSRFNPEITHNLRDGALKVLAEYQTKASLFEVPGAFELPLACLKIAESQKFSGIVALGCVIQGDTPHFDYVCSETTRGIGEVTLKTGVPIGFGLLTTDNLKQAQARSQKKGENKGAEAALVTLEMIQLLENI